jgi:hypothetical protein
MCEFHVNGDVNEGERDTVAKWQSDEVETLPPGWFFERVRIRMRRRELQEKIVSTERQRVRKAMKAKEMEHTHFCRQVISERGGRER